MSRIIKDLKNWIKGIANVHQPADEPNFFLFTMPRSGSTWLMELLVRQPKFKYFSELFNLRNKAIAKHLGIETWEELYQQSNEPKIQKYLEGIISGKLSFLNPNPFGEYHRFKTSRIVFKILHFGEHKMNWFKDQFNGKVIFLIRHPIAVSVSRKILPRLEVLLNGEYASSFSQESLTYGRKIEKEGTHFEKAIVSWCLQNAIPLRDKKEDWIFVTYEQLVAQPELVVNYLREKLDLQDTQHILDNINKYSMVKSLSDKQTQEIVSSGKRDEILSKWKAKVTPEQEAFVWKTLKIFGLDIYEEGRLLPNEAYLIQEN